LNLIDQDKVVFAVLDSLSAFNMGCYGYDRDTTSFLDSLAENNLVFDFAYSNAPWTVPSHASIFSGDLPEVHGSTSKNMNFESDSFIQDLSCDTLLMSHNPLVSETLGFDKGFDEVWEGNDIIVNARYGESRAWEETDTDSGFIEMSKQLVLNSLKYGEPLMPFRIGFNYLKNVKFREGNRGGKMAEDEGGQDLVNLAVNQVSGSDDFFLFANFLETQEYSATREIYRETGWCNLDYSKAMEIAEKGGVLPEINEREGRVLRDLYDMQIRYTDSLMKQLYERIKEEHPDTVFVFTSDHGQNIQHYEDYTWDHQYAIWERLIRVPLIVAGENIESDEISENFSMKNIGEFFRKEVDPRDITSETVRCSYAGAKGFFFGDSSGLDGYEDWEKEYINNESEAVVKGSNIFVRNSQLDNFTFNARSVGYKQKISQDIRDDNYSSYLNVSKHNASEKEEEVKEKLKDLGYM
jgi:hypothetical protein